MALPIPKKTADSAVGARLTSALVLTTFGLCCGLRLLGGAQWRAGAGATALLTTHDGYAWLAGAERVNQYSDSLLAVLLRWSHALTGCDLTAIAFWLPAFMAPLVVIPLCLLASWWRLPEAAPVAATIAAASFGFLVRTGVGAFDSDVLTLFFPVCVGLCLIVLLEPLMRRPWGRNAPPGSNTICLQAFATGLLLRAYLQFYPSGQAVGLAVLGCAALPGLLLAARGLRCDTAAALAVVLIAGTGSRYGIPAAAALAVLTAYGAKCGAPMKTRAALLALLAAALYVAMDSGGMLHTLMTDFSRYGRIDLTPAGIMLPSTIRSVKEAQALTLPVAVRHMAGNWFVFIAGLAGFAYCVWRRPASLAFAPLLGLGLASMLLGARFSMYGGAAMGAGLGFGSALALRSAGLKPAARYFGQLSLVSAVLWSLMQQAASYRPEPVVRQDFGRALQELRATAAPDAQLWVWWDWGYAAQYYARRTTFADGSRNTGEYTVPLARLYCTPSPRYAWRLLTFTACRQKAAGATGRQDAWPPAYPNPFLHLFHDMPPARSQEFLKKIGTMASDTCGPVPEQYLMVSWDAVKIAKTISELGSWNLATGASQAGRIFPVTGNIEFDMRHGGITVDGAQHAARAVAVLTEKGVQRFSWPENSTSPHIVGNLSTRELFAVDGAIFNSLMVQMLAAKPKTFEPWFTLVVDRLPHVRIYRLNPDAGAGINTTTRP